MALAEYEDTVGERSASDDFDSLAEKQVSRITCVGVHEHQHHSLCVRV